jgi:hypothetical protein
LTIIYYSKSQDVGASDIRLVYEAPSVRKPTFTDIFNGIDEVGATVSVGSDKKKVTGTNTKFTKYCNLYPIYANGEINYVDTVVSDTEMYMINDFSTQFSNVTYKSFPYYCMCSINSDLSDTISREMQNIKNRFERNILAPTKTEQKSLSFTYFRINEPTVDEYPLWTDNLVKLVGIDTKFRTLVTNIDTGDVTMYTNMQLNESSSFSEALDKNDFSFNAKFQDKIHYNENGTTIYGAGQYGLGSYGGYRVTRE